MAAAYANAWWQKTVDLSLVFGPKGAVPRLDWLVIGGGPCGTCAVGSLLQRGKVSVGWVSGSKWEAMGRLGRYGSVPANTRTDRLTTAFKSLDAFEFEDRQSARTAAGERTLSGSAPTGTERLSLSIDALLDASSAMRESGNLALDRDGCRVRALSRTGGADWEVRSDEDVLVCTARQVLLATGARPRTPSASVLKTLAAHGIAVLEHDDVVAPAAPRSDALRRDVEGKRVAVVGGAHSGMLAAMNCHAAGAASVTVYDKRAAPSYAEERDGYIKFDGTGLKGTVAEWTRTAVKKKRLRYVVLDVDDADAFVTAMTRDAVDALVYCVGFEATAPPDVAVDGAPAPPTSGADGVGRLADGLYGAGIAYPEVWTDPEGHTEPRVGFVLHYLAHLNRIFDAAAAALLAKAEAAGPAASTSDTTRPAGPATKPDSEDAPRKKKRKRKNKRADSGDFQSS